MAKNQDRQEQAMQYMQLLQSGVPAADAFKQAYPKGIPTAAQQAAADSKSKQNANLAATGGTIGGLLAAKYGAEYIPQLFSSGASAGTTAAGAGSTIAGGGGGAAYGGGAAALEAPTGLTATAVPGAEVAAPGLMANAAGLGVGPLAAIAGATYLGGKSAYDLMKGKEDKSIPGYIGRGTLGIATGGLSEVARALGIFGHQSTRDVAKKHTNDLMKSAGNDAVAQNYVQGMREQFNTAPVGKAFAGGNYATFDEYKKAGLDPKDLSGVYGNIKTFGPEWAHLSQDQRESVTQGLIGADLYKSKKGEVEITDQDKAKQIYSTILGQQQTPQVQQPQVARGAPAPVNPAFAAKQIAQTGAFGNQMLQALNTQGKK